MRFVVVVLALLTFSSCATAGSVRDSAASSRTGARIDERALMRSHPLSAEVAQLDADIATLEAARSGAWRNVPGVIAGARTGLDQQLANARNRAESLDLAAPPRHHLAAIPRRRNGTSAQLAAYAAALDEREARAIALREAQNIEKESSVEYQFDRAHAGERLHLRLQAAARRSYHQAVDAIAVRLQMLDAQERALVDRQRSRDGSDLAAYRDELASESSVQLASMQRDLVAHAAAARAIPRTDPGIVARAEALPAKADRGRTASAFATAREDLSARFGELHDASAADAGATGSEIQALRTERDELMMEMRAQILTVARDIAREQRLGDAVTTASSPGLPDLTARVRARIAQRYSS